MPTIVFANNFLAGSLLSLLLPVCLLSVIAFWYIRLVRRVPEDTPTSSSVLPSSEVLAAAAAVEESEPPPPAAGDS